MKAFRPKSDQKLVGNVIGLVAVLGLEKGDRHLIFPFGFFNYDCCPAWIEAVSIVRIHLARVLSCMLAQEACKTGV